MEYLANDAAGLLNASITSGDTSLTLQTGQGALFPSAGNFRVRIDDELIIVGARSGDTLSSLTRGAESTSAASHSSSAVVRLVLTNDGLTELIKSYSGMSLIERKYLTSTAANLDFTGIPAIYDSLLIVAQMRGTNGSELVDTQMTFNGDTSAIYWYNYQFAASASVTAGGSSGLNNTYMGPTNAASGPTGRAGVITCEIPNYARTDFYKGFTSRQSHFETTTRAVSQWGGGWDNTAAINRITLTPAAGLWAAGSNVSLYGIRPIIAASTPDTGGQVLLDDYTVSGSVLSEYDTNTRLSGGLPSRFKSLKFKLHSVSDGTVAANVQWQFNSDTTAANYYYGNTESGSTSSGNQRYAGLVSGKASLGVVAYSEAEIFHYASSVGNKPWIASGYYPDASGFPVNRQMTGYWVSGGAPITRIRLTQTVDNFGIGTRFLLYGVL